MTLSFMKRQIAIIELKEVKKIEREYQINPLSFN